LLSEWANYEVTTVHSCPLLWAIKNILSASGTNSLIGKQHLLGSLLGAIGNSGNGNRKWKIETENGNGQNLMQMNVRVKLLINDHFLKTTSVQRPPLYKDHIATRFQRWLRYT